MSDERPPPMPAAGEPGAVTTWRYLRLAMIVLVVGLATAVVYEIVRGGGDCVQTSLSAYYYTHAQAVFVGALVAIGACLICLRGSTDHEDVLLNLAGMFAGVVAFVPTPDAGACASLPGLPQDPTPNIENNVTALLIMGLTALVVLAALSAAAWRRGRRATGRPPSAAALAGYGAALALWAVGGIVFLAARPWFVDHAHGIAAVAMFGCIIAVAVINAFDFRDKQDDPDPRNRYLALGIVMPVVVVGLLVFGGTYRQLAAETAAIVLFALFWVLQTEELWDEGVRPARIAG